jgi:hypothetical protein
MSRFNKLPPEIIDYISGYLPNRASRNAFRESNPYVEDVLGPKELYLTDLPPDILKEIGRKLDTKSKQAYRSSHPEIKKQMGSLKKEIEQLVNEKIKEIYKTPVKLWTPKQENLYKDLIEEMCQMYYGDELKNVSFDFYCNIQYYFAYVNVKLNNKRKIIFWFASGAEEYSRESELPDWFIDCTKNTDFYDVLDDLYKINCHSVDED